MLQDSKTSGLQVTGAFVLQDSWALGLQGAKVLGFLESRASVLHVSTASCFQGSKASGLQSTPKILKVFKSFKAICLERKAPQSRFGQIQSLFVLLVVSVSCSPWGPRLVQATSGIRLWGEKR